MKRIKFSILTVVFAIFCSCVSHQSYMRKIIDKVYIGMPESEFKAKIDTEQLVEANSEITVYKVVKSYYQEGLKYDYRFFYFKDNKLTRIDTGEKAVDLRIKID